MAKGDVTLKFDANTAEFIQKVVSARAALDDTAKKTREVADRFAEAGEKVGTFAEKAAQGIEEVGKFLQLPTTIMGGFDLTMRAIESRIKLAEDRAKNLLTRSATFETAMYTLGTAGQAGEIRERLGAFSKNQYGGLRFDDGQIEKIFAQIVTQVGPRASTEQFISATRTALGAMGAGANMNQAVEAGSGTAVLQSLMPNLSEDEADQMSRFMQLNAPGVLQDPKILGAIATSKDKMSAARFFASGYQEFQGAKRIKPLTEFVEGRPGMTYDKLLENPMMLPPKERAVLQSIIEGQSNLRSVGSRDEAIATALAGSDDISRAARVMRNSEMEGEQILDINASQDTINEAIFKRARAKIDKNAGFDKYTAFDWVVRAQSADPNSLQYRAMNFGSDFTRNMAQEARNEVLEELRGLREAAETQTELLRQQRGPLLKNDNEGQK